MPFLFVAIAAGLFFSYIRPTYSVLLALQEQEARLDATLERSHNLEQRVSDLTQSLNSIGQSDMDKLNLLLPPSVDTVRMVVLLDTLAGRSGIEIKKFTIPVVNELDQDTLMGWSDFSIECSGGYDNMKQFILSMERSLTLMEITKFTIEGTKSGVARLSEATAESVPKYSITFQTPFIPPIN